MCAASGRLLCGGDESMPYDVWGNYPAYLPAFALQNSDDLDSDFLKLPDETQQLLLRQGADSEEGLRRRLTELKERE